MSAAENATRAAARMCEESRRVGSVLIEEGGEYENATNARDILRAVLHWMASKDIDIADELRYAQQDVRRERRLAGMDV